MSALNSENKLLMTCDQIFQITGYKQYKKQCDQLARMGVPFCVDAVGRPVVFVEAARSIFCPSRSSKRRRKHDPNFDFDDKDD